MTDIVPAARPDIDGPSAGLGRSRNYQLVLVVAVGLWTTSATRGMVRSEK